MIERPHTELDEIAKRFADFINEFEPKIPLKPENVDLRHIAEMCYVLEIRPTIAVIFKNETSDLPSETRSAE